MDEKIVQKPTKFMTNIGETVVFLYMEKDVRKERYTKAKKGILKLLHKNNKKLSK